MLYLQVLFYIGSLLLTSCHSLRFIPDIYRTGLVLGASSQFLILVIYNFFSCILSILFSDHLQSTPIVPMVLSFCMFRLYCLNILTLTQYEKLYKISFNSRHYSMQRQILSSVSNALHTTAHLSTSSCSSALCRWSFSTVRISSQRPLMYIKFRTLLVFNDEMQ